MTADHNFTPEQERHVESHAPYLKVFVALLVFTVLEYAYGRAFSQFLPSAFWSLVAGLMIMAIIKATLVGMYFMHLKFEGRWIYMILVPVGILAVVVVLGLIPDMVIHEHADQGPGGIAAPEAPAPNPHPTRNAA